MWRRRGQILAGLATAAAALAGPGVASAQQSIGITSPTGFPAGGDPTYTTTIALDNSLLNMQTPGLETITLAPGVLASLSANPSCLTGAPQYTSGCQIGSGSATVLGLASLPFTAYLVPPPSSADVAGIDLVIVSSTLNTVAHAGIALVQTAAGISSVISTDLSQLGSEAQLISGMTLTVDGTLDGNPFNRMPTNCTAAGATTLSVVYTSGGTTKTETSTASPDFAPTGCGGLPFAPQLSASATKDAGDNGVAVTTTETQAPGQAASASTTLKLPSPTIASNIAAVSLQNTPTPVGTATASTPLLPTPLSGEVYLVGTPLEPNLTIRFPPPVAMTLTGTVGLANDTVTFANQPDVPLTSLVVSFPGGPKSLLTALCALPTGTVQGMFTGQNGKTATAADSVTVSGCPGTSNRAGRPTVSGLSLSGLAAGRPTLRFRVTRGAGAPALKTIAVSLPRGLAFKQALSGISVSAAHRLKLSGGRLTVTLTRPASSVAVKIGIRDLRESRNLIRRARRRPPRLKVRISITDASGVATTRTVVT